MVLRLKSIEVQEEKALSASYLSFVPGLLLPALS